MSIISIIPDPFSAFFPIDSSNKSVYNEPILGVKWNAQVCFNMKEETILKKSKKLLSLFLAALMLMSCFGAISASAMTNEEAETAVAEFNANIPDHSDVYASMSAKQWNSTMTALDKTLSAVLEKQNLKATLYSDATINMLLPMLAGLIPSDTVMIGANMTPAKLSKYLSDNGKYTKVAAYLGTISNWDEFDAAQAVWGVTAGNREEFVTALSWALSTNIGGVISLAVGVAKDAYNRVLVPILESLHQGAMPDSKTFQANAKVDGKFKNELYMTQIINYICDALDDLLATPVAYACEILPDLTYSFGQAMAYLKNASGILGMVIGGIKDSLPNGLSDVIPMVTDGLGLKLTMPEIDENYLITMGTAVVAESGRATTDKGTAASYRVKIEGNNTMVFAAVAQYVGEVLQNPDNHVEIGRFVVSKIGPEYEDNYLEIVEAAKNGTALDVADSCLSLVEEFATNIGAQEDVNPVVAFFAKIVKFFSDLAKKIIALFK